MDLQPQRPLPASGVGRLMAEARQCLSRLDFPQAIQLLQRARGLEPDNHRVLLQLGSVHTEAYDFAAAEKCFETAVRLAPSKTDPLLAAGHHWMEIRHFEAAKNYFEQALREPNAPMVAYIRLTEMYIRLKRLEDAAEIADRGLKLDPTHEGALLTRGKVHRHSNQLAEAETLLRAVVTNPNYGAEARATAGYELGAVLDQQQRFDEAMAAFVEAKTLLRPAAAQASAILRQKQMRMKEAQAAVTPALLQRWRNYGQKEFRPARKLAFLCGHARSGTTLLEYVLDTHPQIVSADETAVFQSKSYGALSRELSAKTPILSVWDSMPARTLRQIRADYFCGMESFLGQPIGERFLLDKNPALTPEIPALARVFPESKFLVALRDPRDVCLSCFMQAWPILPDTVPWLTMEATVQQYALTMGLWLAVRPCLGDAALEVRYEDMVEDLKPCASRVLDFLGLPWNERVLQFHEDAQKKIVRSPTFVEVGKPIYKTAVARWRNYERYLAPHLQTLEPFLKAFGYA